MMLFTISNLSDVSGQRNMEYLSRGLVAVKSENGVFLSWRIFATDTADVAFNIYRNDTLVNDLPITDVSNCIDTSGDEHGIYYLETTINGSDAEFSTPVVVWKDQYIDIPVQIPEGYTADDCSFADLDGDGDLEVVVKMDGYTRDNSQSGITDPVELHAYEFNGSLLWKINLGINIRGGSHYTQFMVYDLDHDGKAEVSCKTAPGTVSGTGEYLSKGPAVNDDDAADYRNSAGRILSGPEYLTVFSGLTGEELSTVEYVPLRGSVSAWGDSYGNRVDRFLACVACLDGINPSLVMCRGYYTRTVIAAWDFHDNSLSQRWVFDTDNGYSYYEGQGNHNLSVGDVDFDGKDEIMYGSMAVDDDGAPLYNTNLLHGDASHLGDFIPGNGALEFYMPHENANRTNSDGVLIPGVHVRNAGTGEIIWSKKAAGTDRVDVGRAVTGDVSPEHPGNEFWADQRLGVYNSQGEVISDVWPGAGLAVWWDGDLAREMLDGPEINKWQESGLVNLLDPSDECDKSLGKHTTPFNGDIFGDWREELVLRTLDNKYLRIYTTVDTTEYGWYTLLQDPQYRLALTWQNTGYNQPPHPGFFLGYGMDTPPVPDISVRSPDNISFLQITSLTNGAEYPKGVTIDILIHALGISDSDKSIIIYDGESALDTISVPPYKTRISKLSTGEHNLKATAFSNKGELINSGVITIFIDSGSPKVSISNPADNSIHRLNDDIAIEIDAYDVDGNIDSVEVYVNNELYATLTGKPYSANLLPIETGIFEINAVAYDDSSNVSMSDTIEVYAGESVIFQEDENFCDFISGGAVESNHSGFTGVGFINTDNLLGNGAYWAVEFPEKGSYLFTWRYASSSDRPAELKLNDTLATIVEFRSTGEWTSWEEISVLAEADIGLTKVSLAAIQESGLPNIDYMSIVSFNDGMLAKIGSCDSLPGSQTQSVRIIDPNREILLFPMPAQQLLNVVSKSRSDFINEITIYSIDGRIIKTIHDIYSPHHSIDLSDVQNGVYLISVRTERQNYLSRICIAK
jgi:rhamnogalacturonan endolyase